MTKSFIKKVVFSTCLLLNVFTVAMAQDPVLIRTFPMKPTNAYPSLKNFENGSLYFLEKPTGDNIAHPFLVNRGDDFGIVDYLTDRTFVIDMRNNLKIVAEILPWGRVSGDGYLARPDGNFVSLYRTGLSADRDILVVIPDVRASFEGGVWFQSNTLFFWDSNGDLHMIDNPIDVGESSPEIANPVASIKNRAEVKAIVNGNLDGRFSGLAWSDRYGLVRNGLPMGQRYDNDWQVFYEDRRATGKATLKAGYRAVVTEELRYRNLIGTDSDGNQYWGWSGDIIVARNGYIIAQINLSLDIYDGSVVLPSGDIILSSWSNKSQSFSIYRVRKTW